MEEEEEEALLKRRRKSGHPFRRGCGSMAEKPTRDAFGKSTSHALKFMSFSPPRCQSPTLNTEEDHSIPQIFELFKKSTT